MLTAYFKHNSTSEAAAKPPEHFKINPYNLTALLHYQCNLSSDVSRKTSFNFKDSSCMIRYVFTLHATFLTTCLAISLEAGINFEVASFLMAAQQKYCERDVTLFNG